MLKLDHLTLVAPTLADGVTHVRECLDVDVPFGQRHLYMGTHNHLLQLGDAIYLEIVALDPQAIDPGRRRWFGLDDQAKVRADWEQGRRLRGWVARTDDIDAVLARHQHVFGEKVALADAFDFSVPSDGSLPMDGAMPSIIDRRGKARSMASIADLGVRLRKFTIEHPEAERIVALYSELEINRAPVVMHGPVLRYRAEIETPGGVRTLT